MPIKQITHKKISDIVFDQLKEMIINQEWAPGDKIPSENEIAKMMSVSRVSVRSALQRLASIGIIESRQGEGTFVCEYSSARQLEHLTPLLMLSQVDYKALAEFRMILECKNAFLAAQRCTPELLKELNKNYNKYEKSTNKGKENIEVDVDFHLLIAQATQNPFIIEVFSILKNYLIMGISKYQTFAGVESGVRYHKAILDAIKEKDSEKAYKIMEEHLKETIQ